MMNYCHANTNAIPVSNAEMLIHVFMTSRLDNCYASLAGCSARLIDKLQLVQNAAPRVLTRIGKVSPYLPSSVNTALAPYF